MLKSAVSVAKYGQFAILPKLQVVISFIAGQGLVQVINVISGILLIRWLSVNDYAQYSIAFAFQSTAQTLVELGMSGAIVALTGKRIYDKKLIGGYIKAGKHFRNQLYVAVSFFCIILFLGISAHHQWSIYGTLFLLIAILFNLYFTGLGAYYLSPLRIHKRINDIYKVQVKGGMLKLLILAVCSFASVINAVIAAFVNSLIVWLNVKQYKRRASKFIDEPDRSSKDARREMKKYIKPVMPGIIYSAFSAQISLFIISIFGKTEGIAEVGALGRLGQLFLIFNAASSTLIVPFIARQPKERIFKSYLLVLSGSILFVSVASLVAVFFPEMFIWIIGQKYSHLKDEVGLLIINASITLINVLMWDMNCSRRWLWSWIPVLSILSNVLLQILLIMNMDLSTTYNVLIFSIAVSIVNLLNKILVSFIGFNKIKNEADLLSTQ